MKRQGIIAASFAAFGMFCLMGVITSATLLDQNTNSSTTGDMSTRQNMNSNSNMSAMLSSMDRKFMMMAAQGGMAEVEMARVALQRASSDSVKQYAQHMIDDHTRANEELMAVASSKGVTLPTGPDAKQQAMMSKMSQMSGAEFDAAYIKESGVKAHEKMAKLFMDESGKGRDADTKAFAAKTLPTVQMHLQMAREMMNGMNGKKGGGSGNTNTNRGM
ncbi:MAG TPA: DUF4142 domain-containing protein [Pyrinomonadaceae bacterium]|jgi:putative membrane protein|nr:DUF4142 domain-containing protein [Pyrinomonadaceae bacterium]